MIVGRLLIPGWGRTVENFLGLAARRALGRIWGRPWGVAKLVRRLTLDQEIVGSNPTAPALSCLKT